MSNMKINFEDLEREFKLLSDNDQQKYFDMVVNILGESLYCDRVWSAWGYGTMSSDDFHNMSDDDSYVYDKSVELYGFIKNQLS